MSGVLHGPRELNSVTGNSTLSVGAASAAIPPPNNPVHASLIEQECDYSLLFIDPAIAAEAAPTGLVGQGWRYSLLFIDSAFAAEAAPTDLDEQSWD